MPPKKAGKFITALGLPCSGKSSVMAELGKVMNSNAVYLEPEESSWPKAVVHRNQYEYFSCLMWFRSIRVPMLYEAEKRRALGETVITDCYYDKVLKHYLGMEATDWILKKDDPYYKVSSQIATLDWEMLPEADCVVVFLVQLSDWTKMLKKRNRVFDANASIESAYQTQDYFIEIAEKLNQEKGIKKIIFEQTLSTPSAAAERLHCELIANKIIDPNNNA